MNGVYVEDISDNYSVHLIILYVCIDIIALNMEITYIGFNGQRVRVMALVPPGCGYLKHIFA